MQCYEVSLLKKKKPVLGERYLTSAKMKSFLTVFVSREFVATKLTYFFWNGKNTFVSYLPVFLEDIGLTPSQVSIVFSLRILSQFAGNIVWAVIADLSVHYRVLVFMLCFLAVCFTVPQPFVAPLLAEKLVTLMDTNATHVKTNASVRQPIRLVTHPQLIYFLGLLNVFGAFFEGGIHSQVDSFVVKYVVEKHSIKSYGVQRLFGACGSAIFAFVIGITIDVRTLKSMPVYSPIFPWYVVLMLLFLVSFYKIIQWSEKEKKTRSTNTPRVVADDVKFRDNPDQPNNNAEPAAKNYDSFLTVIRRIDVFPFYVFVFLNGLAYGVNMGIGMIHLTNLNASYTTMGLYLLLRHLSSIVVYPISSKIISACGGPLAISALSSLVYCARFVSLGFIQNHMAILPLQLTQGVNGALFWVATIEYTYAKSNPRIATTMFGTLNASYKGASRSLGVFLAGVLYERFGGHKCYLYMGFACAVVAVFNVAYVAYLKRTANRLNAQTRHSMRDIVASSLRAFDWDEAFYNALYFNKTNRAYVKYARKNNPPVVIHRKFPPEHPKEGSEIAVLPHVDAEIRQARTGSVNEGFDTSF